MGWLIDIIKKNWRYFGRKAVSLGKHSKKPFNKNKISDFGAQNIGIGQNTGGSHLGGRAIFP